MNNQAQAGMDTAKRITRLENCLRLFLEHRKTGRRDDVLALLNSGTFEGVTIPPSSSPSIKQEDDREWEKNVEVKQIATGWVVRSGKFDLHPDGVWCEEPLASNDAVGTPWMAAKFPSEFLARAALAKAPPPPDSKPPTQSEDEGEEAKDDGPPPVPYNKHEAECLELIDARDEAEEALSQAFYAVTGRSPEWSNLFGHDEAVSEIAEAVNLLKEAAKPSRKSDDGTFTFTTVSPKEDAPLCERCQYPIAQHKLDERGRLMCGGKPVAARVYDTAIEATPSPTKPTESVQSEPIKDLVEQARQISKPQSVQPWPEDLSVLVGRKVVLRSKKYGDRRPGVVDRIFCVEDGSCIHFAHGVGWMAGDHDLLSVSPPLSEHPLKQVIENDNRQSVQSEGKVRHYKPKAYMSNQDHRWMAMPDGSVWKKLDKADAATLANDKDVEEFFPTQPKDSKEKGVQRWEASIGSGFKGGDCVTFTARELGDWVKFTDHYSALKSANERAEAAEKKMQQLIHAHAEFTASNKQAQ